MVSGTSSKSNQSGFTIVEALIAASISFLLVSVGLAASLNLMQWWNSGNASKSAYTMKITMLQSLQSSKAWWNTINDPTNDHIGNINSNGNMICLQKHTDCSTLAGKSIRFRLLDGNKNLVYDPFVQNSGFGNFAALCSNYDSKNGNASCPFTYDLRWTPICPPSGKCIDPVVSISANFSYKFPSGVTTVLNPVNYDIKQAVSAPQVLAPLPPVDVYYTMVNQGFTANIQAAAQANFSGGTITITKVSSPSNGSVTLNSDGTATYTPNNNYMGLDSYNYQMQTNQGATSFGTVWVEVVTPFTWMGTAGDGKWLNGQNWCGSINATNTGCLGASSPPPSTQSAIFNNVCGSNCNATISSDINPGGIEMESSYQGTITQTNGTITVGKSGLIEYGGTLAGSTSNSSKFDVQGNFTLAGGSFTAPAGDLNLESSVNIETTSNFKPSTGQVLFSCGNFQSCNVYAPAAQFNDVNFDGYFSTTTLCVPQTSPCQAGSITVNGTLTTDGGYGGACGQIINSGTIIAKGDINVTGHDMCGDALIKIAGSQNQTLNGSPGVAMPNIEIASTGGLVKLTGAPEFLYNSFWKNNPTNSASFTYTSGSVDASTANPHFYCNNYSTCSISPGSIQFQDVTIDGYFSTTNLSGNMDVEGTLTFAGGYSGPCNQRINNGTIVAKGDVDITTNDYCGTTTLELATTGVQTLTDSGSYAMPNVKINATGDVDFSGSPKFLANDSKSTFTYVSGTVNPGTAQVSFMCPNFANCTLTPGSISFNDVTFDGYYSTTNLVNTIAIHGKLTLDGGYGQVSTNADGISVSSGGYQSLNGGTILAYGDVLSEGYNYVGSTLLKLVGSGQSFTGTAGIATPSIEVASSGSVDFKGTPTLLSGFIAEPTSFKYVSGSVTVDASTVYLSCPTYSVCNMDAGPIKFNNVIVDGNADRTLITGSLNVTNLLLYGLQTGIMNCHQNYQVMNDGPGLYTGKILLSGNLHVQNGSYCGDTEIDFVGNSTQDFQDDSDYQMPGDSVIVNSASSTVRLTSDVDLHNLGSQSLDVIAGGVDMAGHNLTITNNLSLNGNTITKNSGTLTVNGKVVSSGTAYGGTVSP